MFPKDFHKGVCGGRYRKDFLKGFDKDIKIRYINDLIYLLMKVLFADFVCRINFHVTIIYKIHILYYNQLKMCLTSYTPTFHILPRGLYARVGRIEGLKNIFKR